MALLLVGVQGCTRAPEPVPSPAAPRVAVRGAASSGQADLDGRPARQKLRTQPAPAPAPTKKPVAMGPMKKPPAVTNPASATAPPRVLAASRYPKRSPTSAPRVVQLQPPAPVATASATPAPSGDDKGPERGLQGIIEISGDAASGRKSAQIVYYLVEVTPTASSAPRGPAALALVIDVSGSMSDSLDLAAAAASHLFAKAKPEDQACLIAFANRAEVVVGMASGAQPGVPRILSLLAGAQVGGGTEMSTGISAAIDQLGKLNTTHACHILLVGDGGTTDSGRCTQLCLQAWRGGMSVSTVGVGSHNVNLMRALAEHSNGRYFAVTDPADLPNVVMSEVANTRNIYLRDLRIQSTFSPGTALRRVFDVKSLRELKPNADSHAEIALGDVYPKDVKQVLFEVEIQPGTASDQVLAEVQVHSKNPDATQRAPLRLPDVRVKRTSGPREENAYVMKLVDRIYAHLSRRQ